MLVNHTTIIVEEKFKFITIPQIGYIRKAIFQALDNMLQENHAEDNHQNNLSLDWAYSNDDLFTKSECTCRRHKMSIKRRLLIKRFKPLRPSNDKSRATWQTRYFRIKSLDNYKKKDDGYFICRKNGYFTRNCPQDKKSKSSVHLFEDIADHAVIYLSTEDDLESVFSLKEE